MYNEESYTKYNCLQLTIDASLAASSSDIAESLSAQQIQQLFAKSAFK